MAGPKVEDDADLKGLGKIFNSRTMAGRANVRERASWTTEKTA